LIYLITIFVSHHQHLTQFCFCMRCSVILYKQVNNESYASLLPLNFQPFHIVKIDPVQNIWLWTQTLWKYKVDWIHSRFVMSLILVYVAVQESWMGQDRDQLHHRQGNATANHGCCSAWCWHWGSEFLAWNRPCVLYMTLFSERTGYTTAGSKTSVKLLSLKKTCALLNSSANWIVSSVRFGLFYTEKVVFKSSRSLNGVSG
jgi:hypothetical protein